MNELNGRADSENIRVPTNLVQCPPDFCKNGGTCKITNGRPKCNCPATYGGINCAMSKSDLELIQNQNNHVTNNLLDLVSSDATKPEMTDIVNTLQ